MREGITGVLFDLDGLLIDSERVGISVLMEETRKMGSPVSEAFLCTLLGVTRDMGRALWRENYPAVDFDRLYDLFAVRMLEKAGNGEIPLKKGAASLMRVLNQHAVPHCVASSSPRKFIGIYLRSEGLLDDAPDFVSSEEVKRSKPAPDVFLKAAERIGADIGHCLILEDSPNGLIAARKSGAHVGMVPDLIPWSSALAPYTDHVFRDLDEVREWLEL